MFVFDSWYLGKQFSLIEKQCILFALLAKSNIIIMPSHFLYFSISCNNFCNNFDNNNNYNNGYNKNYFYIQNSDFVPLPKIILAGSNLKS